MPEHPDHHENISKANKKLRSGEKQKEMDKDDRRKKFAFNSPGEDGNSEED